jgi:LmbE family N-acetylglucosaminyl deacetylase
MQIAWPDAEHIYLSPHLDDAVLSCGGMIAAQATRGERVAVITVCAGSPPQPVPDTPLMRELHDRWQTAAPDARFADIPALRRAEDLRAIHLLAPGIRAIHLDHLDCIYRVHPVSGAPLYPSEAQLKAHLQPDDQLLDDLRDVELLPAGATLYVPLAIGQHVDHQAVRRAAESWGIARAQMVYFEDYPYAEEEGVIETAIKDDDWESQTVALHEEATVAKIRAITAYQSQISSFWPDLAAMESAVREFAALRGGERLWVRSARSARRRRPGSSPRRRALR